MTAEPTPQTFTEYLFLRNGCGIVDLQDWSSVTLAGDDRQSFLHSFCTNDIKKLQPDQSCEAFFCNVKGKIIGYGIITCREKELVVIGAPGQGAALVSHLDRYLIREKVRLRDTTAERRYLLVAGTVARDMFARLAPSNGVENPWLTPMVNKVGHIGDMVANWIHWPLFGPWFAGLLEVEAGTEAKTIHALQEDGGMRCNRIAFDMMRIEAGTPLYGVDFNENNLPQEVGRDAQAISFSKGCYLGQETVARIDALGHVNQRLVGVTIQCRDTPPVGTELVAEGHGVGRVTSVMFSPLLGQQLALAIVRREVSEVGSKLESSAGQWEVVNLPVPPRLVPIAR